MNGWETELVKTVVHYAPVLGTALAGPAGGAVGTLISNVFGSEDKKELCEHIKSDPKAEEKLKKLEEDHEIELKKLAIQQSAIDAVKSIVEMDK